MEAESLVKPMESFKKLLISQRKPGHFYAFLLLGQEGTALGCSYLLRLTPPPEVSPIEAAAVLP